MLKRLFELLGLATMAVGLYFVVHEQTQNSACNALGGKFAGLGMDATCQHTVYVYFGGFVLLALGSMVVIFGLLATRKAAKRRLTASHGSRASRYQWVDPRTGRTPRS